MAAICSPQWINDGIKNQITNTCFIFKVFYRCLMNTDCNIVLTWIILIWHKPQTLHIFPLTCNHALWRMYRYTHFITRTLTHVPLPPQTRSLTHLRLMTVSAPKTLTILIQLSKYVDDIKMKDKCNKIMPLGSEINWQDVFFDMSFIYLKMYTLNYFTFIFFI